MPIVLFVATLPLLVSLGHDAYLYYLFYIGENETFNFPALGWIWATYHEDSLIATGKFIAENISEDVWKTLAGVLKYKASILGLIFAGIFYVPCLFLKALGPKKDMNSSDRLLSRHRGKKRVKYNRR